MTNVDNHVLGWLIFASTKKLAKVKLKYLAVLRRIATIDDSFELLTTNVQLNCLTHRQKKICQTKNLLIGLDFPADKLSIDRAIKPSICQRKKQVSCIRSTAPPRRRISVRVSNFMTVTGYCKKKGGEHDGQIRSSAVYSSSSLDIWLPATFCQTWMMQAKRKTASPSFWKLKNPIVAAS